VEEWVKKETSIKQVASRRRTVPPQCQLIFSEIQGVISRKVELFKPTSARIIRLTFFPIICLCLHLFRSPNLFSVSSNHLNLGHNTLLLSPGLHSVPSAQHALLSGRADHTELSSPARTLGSWVRITLEAGMSVCIHSVFVLFCV
jgi:hypothetical protein